MRLLLVPVLQPILGVHDVTEVPVDWALSNPEECLTWRGVRTPPAPRHLCVWCRAFTWQENHRWHRGVATR